MFKFYNINTSKTWASFKSNLISKSFVVASLLGTPKVLVLQVTFGLPKTCLEGIIKHYKIKTSHINSKEQYNSSN